MRLRGSGWCRCPGKNPSPTAFLCMRCACSMTQAELPTMGPTGWCARIKVSVHQLPAPRHLCSCVCVCCKAARELRSWALHNCRCHVVGDTPGIAIHRFTHGLMLEALVTCTLSTLRQHVVFTHSRAQRSVLDLRGRCRFSAISDRTCDGGHVHGAPNA